MIQTNYMSGKFLDIRTQTGWESLRESIFQRPERTTWYFVLVACGLVVLQSMPFLSLSISL